MSCTVCHRDIRIVAKGLCNACYQRKRTRGTTAYAPKRIRGVCSVKGCGKPHAARGFCDLHHQRLLTAGDPEKTNRPDSWGAKTKHPQYHRWSNLMRYRSQHPVEPEWCDFLQFISDISPVPDGRVMLFAADETKPIGPQNYVWKHSITERAEGEDENTYKARRARTARRITREAHSGYDLKRNYGLSNEAKAQMLADQGGKCAICKCDEKRSIRGKRVGLAVDHCHSTGKVRGLLCYSCNTALGLFNDDRLRLECAVQYLESAGQGSASDP